MLGVRCKFICSQRHKKVDHRDKILCHKSIPYDKECAAMLNQVYTAKNFDLKNEIAKMLIKFPQVLDFYIELPRK